MKFPTPALSTEPGEALTPVSPGGDDFLSRVTNAIQNFKEVLKIARELKGIKGEFTNPDEVQESRAPGQAFDLDKALAPVLQRYGDKTVAEIMKTLSPLTLNQIMGVIKRAGFGK